MNTYTAEQLAAAKGVYDVPGYYEGLIAATFQHVDLTIPAQRDMINDHRASHGLTGFWFRDQRAVKSVKQRPRVLALTEDGILHAAIEEIELEAPYSMTHFTYRGVMGSSEQFDRLVDTASRSHQVIVEVDRTSGFSLDKSYLLEAIWLARSDNQIPGAMHGFHCIDAENTDVTPIALDGSLGVIRELCA